MTEATDLDAEGRRLRRRSGAPKAGGSAGGKVSFPPAPWKKVTSRTFAPYLFLLPNMLVFGLFTIWPAINGFRISFYDSDNGRRFEYVGTENFRRILGDERFSSMRLDGTGVVRNTLIFVVLYVFVVTILSTLLALMLDAQRRGSGPLRAAFFLPVVISPVVVGVVWSWMFKRKGGIVNALLEDIGIGPQRWLLDKKLAMLVIIAAAVWVHVGFYAMILLAGLKGIPTHLYEAARIDGANTVQRIRRITLPLLLPTTMVVIVLSTIAGFQAFDFVYTLTGGGPVGGTTLIVQYIYERAFTSPIQYGLASAAGLIFFVVVFAATLLNYFVGHKKEAM
jgi:alpha-1,4-digalacturonate transport system permease protein